MRLSNYLRLSVKKAFVPGARGGAAGLVDILQCRIHLLDNVEAIFTLESILDSRSRNPCIPCDRGSWISRHVERGGYAFRVACLKKLAPPSQ